VVFFAVLALLALLVSFGNHGFLYPVLYRWAPGWALFRGQEHPTRAVLVIEVADSSLHFDRREKGSLYARARIAEYWIVNLIDRVLEVYRDPEPDPLCPHGWRYRAVSRLAPPAVVAPVALPAVEIRVGDLLA
jgi:Uma2 family endonuclease